jgi:DNA-binding response OmpR family regulator
MKHPERVHSRAQLLDKVWGDHVFIESARWTCTSSACAKRWACRRHG